jgi:predicted Holliday junction resolvase-like endonuclease
MVDATLIITLAISLVAVFVAFWVGHKWGAFRKEQYWIAEMPGHRKDAVMRSRSVLGGHFSEQLAPYLPDFEFLPNECMFMGKPIDFIVFKGMDEKNISEVIFVEVKSGKARLNAQEKNLKETIDGKKVRWVEYRIPEDLTKKGDIEDRIKDFVGEE